jgi:hypothetical protein
LQTLTSINLLKFPPDPVITSERATNDTPIQAQLRALVLPFEAGGARLRGATALSIWRRGIASARIVNVPLATLLARMLRFDGRTIWKIALNDHCRRTPEVGAECGNSVTGDAHIRPSLGGNDRT